MSVVFPNVDTYKDEDGVENPHLTPIVPVGETQLLVAASEPCHSIKLAVCPDAPRITAPMFEAAAVFTFNIPPKPVVCKLRIGACIVPVDVTLVKIFPALSCHS